MLQKWFETTRRKLQKVNIIPTDSMKQAVQYVRDGGKCAEAARRFGVNRETVRSIKGAYLMFLLLAFTHTKCNTPTLINYLLVFNIIPTIIYRYSFCVIFCLFTLSSKNKRKLWKNYQHLYITYLFSLHNKVDLYLEYLAHCTPPTCTSCPRGGVRCAN